MSEPMPDHLGFMPYRGKVSVPGTPRRNALYKPGFGALTRYVELEIQTALPETEGPHSLWEFGLPPGAAGNVVVITSPSFIDTFIPRRDSGLGWFVHKPKGQPARIIPFGPTQKHGRVPSMILRDGDIGCIIAGPQGVGMFQKSQPPFPEDPKDVETVITRESTPPEIDDFWEKLDAAIALRDEQMRRPPVD